VPIPEPWARDRSLPNSTAVFSNHSALADSKARVPHPRSFLARTNWSLDPSTASAGRDALVVQTGRPQYFWSGRMAGRQTHGAQTIVPPQTRRRGYPTRGAGGLFLTKIARPLADRRISGAGEWPGARHTGGSLLRPRLAWSIGTGGCRSGLPSRGRDPLKSTVSWIHEMSGTGRKICIPRATVQGQSD